MYEHIPTFDIDNLYRNFAAKALESTMPFATELDVAVIIPISLYWFVLFNFTPF